MRRLALIALAALAGTPAPAQPPRIVADTPVTASLIRQVLGDPGEVRILLPRGASPHHHQLRPSDAGALQQAQLLVWIGPELTPWLDKAAGTLGGDTAQLRLLAQPGTHLRTYGEVDDHDHDDHAGDDGHDHDHSHGGTDPHAWLDPANARIWRAAIAAELGRRDPGNAAAYRANAAAAAARIDALDARIAQDLAPLTDRRFVVFHDAYGYFTGHYGLAPAVAVSLGDATAPSAARLRQVRADISGTGARCAFPEYGQDPRLIESAITGTEARIGGEIDPAGTALEPGAGLYGQLLRAMADALIGCLSRE